MKKNFFTLLLICGLFFIGNILNAQEFGIMPKKEKSKTDYVIGTVDKRVHENF